MAEIKLPQHGGNPGWPDARAYRTEIGGQTVGRLVGWSVGRSARNVDAFWDAPLFTPVGRPARRPSPAPLPGFRPIIWHETSGRVGTDRPNGRQYRAGRPSGGRPVGRTARRRRTTFAYVPRGINRRFVGIVSGTAATVTRRPGPGREAAVGIFSSRRAKGCHPLLAAARRLADARAFFFLKKNPIKNLDWRQMRGKTFTRIDVANVDCQFSRMTFAKTIRGENFPAVTSR